MKKHLKPCYFLALAWTTAALSTPASADDLLQDAGNWLQVVGEGSLK